MLLLIVLQIFNKIIVITSYAFSFSLCSACIVSLFMYVLHALSFRVYIFVSALLAIIFISCFFYRILQMRLLLYSMWRKNLLLLMKTNFNMLLSIVILCVYSERYVLGFELQNIVLKSLVSSKLHETKYMVEEI